MQSQVRPVFSRCRAFEPFGLYSLNPQVAGGLYRCACTVGDMGPSPNLNPGRSVKHVGLFFTLERLI
jgi:hypothetical protein